MRAACSHSTSRRSLTSLSDARSTSLALAAGRPGTYAQHTAKFYPLLWPISVAIIYKRAVSSQIRWHNLEHCRLGTE